MKKLLFTGVLLVFVGSAADLTETDKTAGLAHLDRTRQGVIDATKGLSDAQWKFKPTPESWSVAECLEHIAITEDFLLANAKKMMTAPAGKPDRDVQALDKLVTGAISDRSHKAKAPEPVQPKARWTPKEALDHFLTTRTQTIEFLKTTSGLRDHVADSPLRQPLDAYQWLLYISAHAERHTKQMLEVKADPRFPR